MEKLLKLLEEQKKRVEELKETVKNFDKDRYKKYTELRTEWNLKRKLSIESAYLEGLEDSVKEVS